MEPVQPRRMTYAEQLEAMRPPCGFCILADGTILLSNRPETYTAEMVVDAYEAWRKMKADGLVRETRPAAQWVYYWNKSDIHHLLKMARGSMYIFFCKRHNLRLNEPRVFLYRSNIHHESAMTMTRRHTAPWAAWWTRDRSMNSISNLRIKVRKKTRFDQFWCKLEKLEIVYLKKVKFPKLVITYFWLVFDNLDIELRNF